MPRKLDLGSLSQNLTGHMLFLFDERLQTMLAQRKNLVGGQSKVSVLKPGSDTICNTHLGCFKFLFFFHFIHTQYQLFFNIISFHLHNSSTFSQP